jgi:hypothetical protein
LRDAGAQVVEAGGVQPLHRRRTTDRARPHQSSKRRDENCIES